MGKEAKYVVRLTMEERETLEALLAAGRAAADKLLRARMLLKADIGEGGPGWTDEEIAEAFEVGQSTVHRLRQRLVEEGVEATLIRELVDVHYVTAEKVVLVQDNLNTHKPASLYEAFPPDEARRILDKLEIHYTPKHGSWLYMAETELGILSRQCLDRRLESRKFLTSEVAAWETDRNGLECKVHWQFTTADARTKLWRLYPVIEPVNN